MTRRKPMDAIHFPTKDNKIIQQWCWRVFLYCRHEDREAAKKQIEELETRKPEVVIFT